MSTSPLVSSHHTHPQNDLWVVRVREDDGESQSNDFYSYMAVVSDSHDQSTLDAVYVYAVPRRSSAATTPTPRTTCHQRGRL